MLWRAGVVDALPTTFPPVACGSNVSRAWRLLPPALPSSEDRGSHSARTSGPTTVHLPRPPPTSLVVGRLVADPPGGQGRTDGRLSVRPTDSARVQMAVVTRLDVRRPTGRADATAENIDYFCARSPA